MTEKKTLCARCGATLELLPPPGLESGTFSATCPRCGTVMLVELMEGGVKVDRVVREGAPPPPLVKKRFTLPVGAPKGSWGYLSNLRDILSSPLSLRAARVYLVVAALLFSAHFIYLLYSATYLKGLEELHPTDRSTVAVNVYDNLTGRGIEGAVVTIEDLGRRGETNSFGHVVFEEVDKGEHRLKVSAPGYVPVETTIVVRVGTPNVWDVYLSNGSAAQASREIPPTPQRTTYDLMVYASPAGALFAGVAYYLIGKRDYFFLAFTATFLSTAGFGFLVGSLLSALAALSVALHYREFRHLKIIERRMGGSPPKVTRSLPRGEADRSVRTRGS